MPPVKPPPESQTSRDKRDAATYSALALLALLALAGVTLVSLVIPQFIFIVAVFAGLVVIGVVQYVLWGWMLDKYRVTDDDDE